MTDAFILGEDQDQNAGHRRGGWHQAGFYQRDVSWHADAICAQTDPELWFPDKGESTKDAKSICAECLVRAECLEYALDVGERFGVWGMTSERERRRLMKRFEAGAA